MKSPGGPKSLTLGSDAAENKRQIGRFSSADAESFGRYEEQLEQFVDTIDPLLDHAPAKLLEFAKAGERKSIRSSRLAAELRARPAYEIRMLYLCP